MDPDSEPLERIGEVDVVFDVIGGDVRPLAETADAMTSRRHGPGKTIIQVVGD